MLKKIIIVNNTLEDISFVHSALVKFAKTGKINPELVDIFNLQRIETEEGIKVIVEFI